MPKTTVQKILIVDDEADIRNLIKGILEDEGYATQQAATSKITFEILRDHKPDLIILDIWLHGSDHDGLQILEEVRASAPHLPVIMISGHGTIQTAVQAIKKGAYDFIEKPFKTDRLLLMIRRALEAAALHKENDYLRRYTKKPIEFTGSSQAIETLRSELKSLATGVATSVLIAGESGVGKNIAARYIHHLSPRAKDPFVIVNCTKGEAKKIEKKWFGQGEAPEKNRHIFERIMGGSLLIDNIAALPESLQAELFSALQGKEVKMRNETKRKFPDLCVMATAKDDIVGLVRTGRFHEGLYNMLSKNPVSVPSLRDRPEDLEDLVEEFSEELSAHSGLNVMPFTQGALETMRHYDWPGNIRQLRNVLEGVFMRYDGTQVKRYDVQHLPPEITGKPADAELRESQNPGGDVIQLPLREAREIFERQYLQKQVERFAGNISQTAKFIGMERSALHRKLKALELQDADQNSQAQAEEKRG